MEGPLTSIGDGIGRRTGAGGRKGADSPHAQPKPVGLPAGVEVVVVGGGALPTCQPPRHATPRRLESGDRFSSCLDTTDGIGKDAGRIHFGQVLRRSWLRTSARARMLSRFGLAATSSSSSSPSFSLSLSLRFLRLPLPPLTLVEKATDSACLSAGTYRAGMAPRARSVKERKTGICMSMRLEGQILPVIFQSTGLFIECTHSACGAF